MPHGEGKKPTLFEWFWMRDFQKWDEYRTHGGKLNYDTWNKQGQSAEDTALTPYAAAILERTGGIPPEAAVAPEKPPTVPERIEVEEAIRAETEEPRVEELAVPEFPTEAPPEGYRWELNEFNQWVPTPDPFAAREPTGMSETERAQLELRRREEATRIEEEGRAFEAQQAQQLWQRGQAQQQFGLQQQEAQQQAEYFAWQQGEVERQQRAQLSAQPESWLQYAAYTGEQPAIQPWMIPLMGQQYAGTVAGAPLPGWEGGTDLSQLPELTRPSRQFQARMGPTALAQYQGYQQARTGIRPEETQFRLWSGAPPGGQRQGLQFTR